MVLKYSKLYIYVSKFRGPSAHMDTSIYHICMYVHVHVWSSIYFLQLFFILREPLYIKQGVHVIETSIGVCNVFITCEKLVYIVHTCTCIVTLSATLSVPEELVPHIECKWFLIA